MRESWEDFKYPEETFTDGQESVILGALLDWLYPAAGRAGNRRLSPRSMIVRAYVLIWYLRPEWLHRAGEKTTQADVARMLGIPRAVFNRQANKFRKHFGFQKAGMRSEEARQKFSECASRNRGIFTEARRRAAQRKKIGGAEE